MGNTLNRITVFCGSSFGNHKAFEENAYLLGQTLAEQNIELVYGGANVGLMGTVANGALSKNGKVIGVLPEFLQEKELAHTGLSELIITQTMQERKTKMDELSDGVISLPGGYGTFEELFEMLTWASLSLHEKPIAILNINGFYDDLINMVQKMVDYDFLKTEYQAMLIVDSDISKLIQKMKEYKAPTIKKWNFVSKES